jgi:hypothetical protein
MLLRVCRSRCGETICLEMESEATKAVMKWRLWGFPKARRGFADGVKTTEYLDEENNG